MALTRDERQFLDAYIYEVTHGPPFGGPATRNLSQKGIAYLDLSWLLTAYQRELSAEGKSAAGTPHEDAPPSPWDSLDEVKCRSGDLKEELRSKDCEPREVSHL